jgi:hypothetical protein
MSVCRGARDLTFQYPCSLRFPLQAGGTMQGLVPLCAGSPCFARGTAQRFGFPCLQVSPTA